MPGPQTLALESEAFELLFGGAAGGGKSTTLLGMARLNHRSSILLRRTYPELEDSLVLQSQGMYDGRYNRNRYVWTFGDGRRIRFGHLEYDKNVHQYQSAQFDLIGFDELTQFSRHQYEYMLSRARTTTPGQRVRVVGCTNPGGEGNDWVMERWAAWLDEGYPNPAKPGELRWFKRLEDGREVETDRDDPDGVSRTFIPAKLSDNPYLGDDYRRQLALLPEPYRSQLLHGDWKAGQVDDAYQVIPTAWIRAAQARWTPAEPGRGSQGRRLVAVGVDVARGGEDKTVLARLYEVAGNGAAYVGKLEKHPGRATPDGQSVAGLVGIALAEGGPGKAEAHVDVIGVGASAYDIARMKRLPVVAVNFAEKSPCTDKSGKLNFVNIRAECYWRLRELLDPESGDNIALPPDPELLGDLRAHRWTMQSNGIKIESKEQISERLGRSPDCGDAVALAFYQRKRGVLYA